MRKIVGLVIVALLCSRAVFSQNYTIQTFAGGGIPQGLPANFASLGAVAGLATDSAGDVYISLASYSAVVRMDATTRVLTLIAGNGTAGYSGDNGLATTAQLNNPTGLALDTAGNLYIADFGNNRIRKVSNDVITTVSGGGAGAQLSHPTGVAVDTSGNLYIADSGNNVVRKVSGGVTVTVAGTGTPGGLGDGGPATSAQLNTPEGVAIDTLGNLYIADSGNDAVVKVSNGILTTVYIQQGARPVAVAVDGARNVFFVANGLYAVGELSVSGNVTLFAGNGTPGYSGGWQFGGQRRTQWSARCCSGCQRQCLYCGLQQ